MASLGVAAVLDVAVSDSFSFEYVVEEVISSDVVALVSVIDDSLAKAVFESVSPAGVVPVDAVALEGAVMDSSVFSTIEGETSAG